MSTDPSLTDAAQDDGPAGLATTTGNQSIAEPTIPADPAQTGTHGTARIIPPVLRSGDEEVESPTAVEGSQLEDWVMADHFLEAMEEHARTCESPVPWNEWQKVARDVGSRYPEAVQRKGQSRWFAEVRRQVNDRVFGADWKSGRQRLVQKEFDERADSLDAAAAVSSAGRTSPELLLEQPRAQPVAKAAALRALHAMAAADAASQAEVAVSLHYLDPSVARVIKENEREESETTSLYQERVTNLCGELTDAGEVEESITFAARVQAQDRKVMRKFADRQDETVSLVAWATQQLQEGFQYEPLTLMDSQALLQALSRAAQLPAQRVRTMAMELPSVRAALKQGSVPPFPFPQEPSPAGFSLGPSLFQTPESDPDSWLNRVRGEVREAEASAAPAIAGQGRFDSPTRSVPTPPAVSPGTAEAQAAAFNAAMLKTMDSIANRLTQQQEEDKNGEDTRRERVNALVGLEFKQSLPVLKDSDTDFESHWRQFQSVLDCHSFGRQGVRPLEVLTVYRRCLPAGSTRLQIYEIMLKRAQKKGRLPNEAKDVLDEIKARLRTAIRETDFQREDRLDREFQALTMGQKTHAEFRAQFEGKLDELEDADIHHETKVLRRYYLSKITDDLRSAVLQKSWPLDGELCPTLRKPMTWEEVAQCVEFELSTRADTKAPKETLHYTTSTSAVEQRGEVTKCRVCNLPGHTETTCASKYAQAQGVAEECRAQAERTGKGCTLCGLTDHYRKHHEEAQAAYYAKLQAPPKSPQGGGGGGRGLGGGGGGGGGGGRATGGGPRGGGGGAGPPRG